MYSWKPSPRTKVVIVGTIIMGVFLVFLLLVSLVSRLRKPRRKDCPNFNAGTAMIRCLVLMPSLDIGWIWLKCALLGIVLLHRKSKVEGVKLWDWGFIMDMILVLDKGFWKQLRRYELTNQGTYTFHRRVFRGLRCRTSTRETQNNVLIYKRNENIVDSYWRIFSSLRKYSTTNWVETRVESSHGPPQHGKRRHGQKWLKWRGEDLGLMVVGMGWNTRKVVFCYKRDGDFLRAWLKSEYGLQKHAITQLQCTIR